MNRQILGVVLVFLGGKVRVCAGCWIILVLKGKMSQIPVILEVSSHPATSLVALPALYPSYMCSQIHCLNRWQIMMHN